MASSSTQFDVDEQETAKKRRRTEDINDSQQLDSDSPNSSSSRESADSIEQNLPTELSKWQEEHIQSLGLDLTTSRKEKLPTPQELLELFPLGIEDEEGQSTPKSFLYNNIGGIENYFMGYSFFHKTLDQEFSVIRREDARALRGVSNYSAKNYFEIKFPSGVDEAHDLWFRRFEACGLQFAEKLYYMTVKRDLGFKCDANGKEKERLKEYDYQFLFAAFASMFGLQSYGWSEPLIPQMTLQLSKTKISGKADILYCKDIPYNAEGTVESNLNVVTVCEVTSEMDHFNNRIERYADRVKKSYSDKKEECHRTTRGSELHLTSSGESRLPSHIPDALLGQHGGELLMYYPYSVKKDAIFGMIVQETKITFTALKMTGDQYEGILTGKPRFSRPRLIVTKPYDYMKKEDRTYLIRPLLHLAMLQEMRNVNHKM